MVDVPPSGAWLLIIAPSGAKYYICIYIASPLQGRNREQIDSLLETTTLPNLDQAAPDLGIHLPLGVIAFTTYLLSLFNADMLKIPSQHHFLVDNRIYLLMYHLSYLE